jgi:hypothetical protein
MIVAVAGVNTALSAKSAASAHSAMCSTGPPPHATTINAANNGSNSKANRALVLLHRQQQLHPDANAASPHTVVCSHATYSLTNTLCK